jgi:DNA-binding IclR family transcriptional regulator
MTVADPDSEALGQNASEPSQLQRGLTILEILATGPRSAAALARDLDVHRSTTLRLLRELEIAGYVRRNADKEYAAVAGRLLTLVPEHHEQHDWIQAVNAVLEHLRDRYGESTNFSVPADGSMVYLSYYPSTHVVSVREGPGAVRPMHCSAIGKAYLAALDATELDRQLSRLSFEGGTSRAASSPKALRAELERTRKRGYAIDDEETSPGVTCVAVAVLLGEDVVGSAGLSAPAGRLASELCDEIATEVASGLADLRRRSANAAR